MRPAHKLLLGVLAILTGLSLRATAADSAALENLRQYRVQRDAIYAHMKLHGINRDDVATMKRLYESSPPYSEPHVKILTKGLYNPGENYRFEMDEYILTMKVPDAYDDGSWIWPYTNTLQADPAMEKLLKESKGILKLASLGWHYGVGVYPFYIGWHEVGGCSITYHTRNVSHVSTPETMREVLTKNQKGWIISQEEVERNAREGMIDNRKGNRIVLTPEPVVINGRIWIHDAMNYAGNRSYFYSTYLQPGRMLTVRFGVPKYDYNANPDLSTYPSQLQKAFKDSEEMAASLRVSRVDDDGAPDPFVIERVEPGPLPVREKLPASPAAETR